MGPGGHCVSFLKWSGKCRPQQFSPVVCGQPRGGQAGHSSLNCMFTSLACFYNFLPKQSGWHSTARFLNCRKGGKNKFSVMASENSYFKQNMKISNKIWKKGNSKKRVIFSEEQMSEARMEFLRVRDVFCGFSGWQMFLTVSPGDRCW